MTSDQCCILRKIARLKYEIVACLCICGIISSGGVTLFFPQIFEAILKQKLVLNEGTPAYDVWKQPTDPVFLKVYLFHVVNPDDIMLNQDKPLIKEKGPFVFRESEEKVNIQNNSENFTTTYQIKKIWHFVPELSNGQLGDYVTTLNMPVIASQEAKRGDWWNSLMLDAVYSSISASLFVNKTAAQLLFDGYEDELLSIAEMSGAKSAVPMDKFGWFYKRNNTLWYDGRFNIYTGGDDYTKIGKIHSWNGKSRTHYKGKCGEMRGSAGGFFSPNMEADTLELFAHDFCRSVSFISVGDIVSIEGLPCHRYELPTTTFANASINPDNWCYENNLPSGLHNATQCKVEEMSPLFLSFPHFYGADSSYISKFHPDSDLSPSKEEHSSSLLMFAKMGILTKLSLKLQLNVRIHPNPSINLLKNAPKDLYFPAIWFEGSTEMSQESAQRLKAVLDLPRIVTIVGTVLCGCSLAGFVLAFALMCASRMKASKSKERGNRKSDRLQGCEMKLLAKQDMQ